MFRRSVAFLDGKLFEFSKFSPDLLAAMGKRRGTACDTYMWMLDIVQQWFLPCFRMGKLHGVNGCTVRCFILMFSYICFTSLMGVCEDGF